jgi:5'-methylthioadenosine phosphorylase
MRLAVIGGTGVYELRATDAQQPITVETAYGPATACRSRVADRDVFFLARHGPEHSLPPHRINYRANIAAVRKLGCTAVVATNAVGSMRTDLPPASFFLPDQFIDFTKARALSFFDGDPEHGVKHVDMTNPYCPTVRQWLTAAIAEVHESCVSGGVYLCAEGPRFETPAEITMFAQWGADVVGMTGVPEVVLAREAGLCYASLCLVTNFAAGISPTPLSHQEVTDLMGERSGAINDVLSAVVARAVDAPQCSCRRPII